MEHDGPVIAEPTKTLSLGSILPSSQSAPAKYKKRALLRGVPLCCVYVIRDGDEVLYVGMTRVRIDNRLLWHLHNNSPLGQAIKQTRPACHDWEADVYAMPDAATAYKEERAIAKALQPQLPPRVLVTQPVRSNVVALEDADWLDHLTENIIAIIVEAGYHIRQTKIRMYWLMGQEITAEERRQWAAYEADATRDRPPSRAYIIRHVGQRLQKYERFIGTGRTALYDAANFAKLCPTETSLEESLQKLEAGKNASWRYVCRHLLPGHEPDQLPITAVLYAGPATLFHDRARGWCLALPIGVELEADSGDVVRVTVKKEG